MARMKTNRKTGGKFWISGAITKPGSLRAYVLNTFGEEGFTNRGTIRADLLEKLAKGTCPTCAGTPETCVCPTKITEQRARLARKLRSFNR